MAVAGFSVGLLPVHLYQIGRQALALPVRIRMPDAEPLRVPADRAERAKVRPRDRGWHLELEHDEGRAILTGREAVDALGLLLPRVNRAGGSGAPHW